MKGILVIIDGMADLPHRLLGDKTPLDVAEMPVLESLAYAGELGIMHPIRPDFIPESDEAIISIFGNDLISSTRGQLEAIGAGVKLTHGDLALRTNFATVDKEGNIVDRRVGRTLTSAEIEELSKAINKIKVPVDFLFKPTIVHKGVLVFRGGFSDEILGNDGGYFEGKATFTDKITLCKPKSDSENAVYSCNVLNDFLERVNFVLGNHKVNKERIRRGFLPANYLLVRGAGTEVPKLKKYPKWMCVANFPLEKGFARVSDMNVFYFDYPTQKSIDSYANLNQGLKEACKFAMKTLYKHYKNSDYAYIHLSETDFPSHDNQPIEKKSMLEFIDENFFQYLKEFIIQNKVKLIVTSNYTSACKLKTHSAEPVPVLFFDPSSESKSFPKKFSEKGCVDGELGEFLGKELFKKVGFGK